jgi:hypothetical protein
VWGGGAPARPGAARRWLINETGAGAAAAALPGAPERFRERVEAAFGTADLAAALDAAADLVLDTADACATMLR